MAVAIGVSYSLTSGYIRDDICADAACTSWLSYSIAPYPSVQKSVNTFGGSGESFMRCVKRMPIIPSAGSV